MKDKKANDRVVCGSMFSCMERSVLRSTTTVASKVKGCMSNPFPFSNTTLLWSIKIGVPSSIKDALLEVEALYRAIQKGKSRVTRARQIDEGPSVRLSERFQ